MGLRISTNVASKTAQKNLRQVSEQQAKSFEKLSSGKRINQAGDDAAGLAISTKMEAQSRSLSQASRNANDAISLVQTAEGSLNEVSNILTRMRELSIQASTDTVGELDREYIDMEYQQLVDEIDRIAHSTSFNGIDLLNGQGKGVLEFQVGAHTGIDNQILFDSDKTDASVGSLGIGQTGVKNQSQARSAIENIDNAIDNINGQRASLGAIQNRMQSAVANLDNQIINNESARSVIVDADIAKESSKLASSNVLKQAATSTLSQANNIPASALNLI